MMNWLKLGLITGMAAMTGCATTGWKAGAPENEIGVIAHRGASAYAPENTLAAFRRASEQGADWFELDCMLTRDGGVIVIHDNTTERTTGVAGRVADMTLAELRALDAGAWKGPEFAGEKLPTLGESLDVGKKHRIGVFVEIKSSDNDGELMQRILEYAEGTETFSPGQRREVLEMIRDSGSRNYELTMKSIAEIRERRMKHQAVIQSFSPIVCAVALTVAPEIRTEYLASRNEERPEQWAQVLRWEQLLNAPGFNLHFNSVDPDLIRNFQNQGKTIAVWTVNDEPTMRRMAEWGVDAIITDYPDVCLRVLGR